jgi:hypothetical protein
LAIGLFHNKTSGFDKESVVVLADPSQKIGDKVQPLIEELQKQSAVNTASISSDYPGVVVTCFPFQ